MSAPDDDWLSSMFDRADPMRPGAPEPPAPPPPAPPEPPPGRIPAGPRSALPSDDWLRGAVRLAR